MITHHADIAHARGNSLYRSPSTWLWSLGSRDGAVSPPGCFQSIDQQIRRELFFPTPLHDDRHKDLVASDHLMLLAVQRAAKSGNKCQQYCAIWVHKAMALAIELPCAIRLETAPLR